MKNLIDEIFEKTDDRQLIVSAINENLQPVLHGRKGGEGDGEYFRKLSFCLGYHIRKVEILKSIVFTFFTHNTIKKGMDRNQILESVDGIIASENDMNALVKAAHDFYGDKLFESCDQRDASYLMTCMKLIIESCLLAAFIHHVSNDEHTSFLSFPPEKLIETFGRTLKTRTGRIFQEIVKSM